MSLRRQPGIYEASLMNVTHKPFQLEVSAEFSSEKEHYIFFRSQSFKKDDMDSNGKR